MFVADLHFEKASWYAAGGQMLPPYDSLATLDRLERVIAQCDATSLWCLGDNFHDNGGASRLDGAVAARLEQLARRVRLNWITGNHDHALDHGFGGAVVPEAVLDGLVLRHRAESDRALPELSGHYHPRLKMRLRGRQVSRPCFVRSNTQLILPAFGALTGGMDADDPAILAIMDANPQAIVATETKAVTFGLQRPPNMQG